MRSVYRQTRRFTRALPEGAATAAANSIPRSAAIITRYEERDGGPGGEEIVRAGYPVHDDLRQADRASLHGSRCSKPRAAGAWRVSLHAGHSPHRLPRPTLDDAAVRGLRNAGGDEPALQGAPQGGRARPERRVRSADADGTRSGPRAVTRRSGEVRRQHRVARRHGAAVRRHRARRHHDVDDDQLAGADDFRDVSRGCGEAGRGLEEALRDDPERHPQRVHRAEGVHLSAARIDAADHRHLRVLLEGTSQVEHDFSERLSHPRSGIDGGTGAGVHAARRHRVRAVRDRRGPRRRRVRAADLVLLQLAQRLLRGDREVPRRPQDLGGSDARSVQGEERALVEAAFPYADRGRIAHGAAALQQRGPDRAPGAGRGARRHELAAHELARRGARAAYGGSGDTRAPDAADHRARKRRRMWWTRLAAPTSSSASASTWSATRRTTSTSSTAWAAWSKRSSRASRRRKSPRRPIASSSRSRCATRSSSASTTSCRKTRRRSGPSTSTRPPPNAS